MIRSAIVLCSVSSLVLSLPQNLPQPGDGCGNDRVTGLARREGDSWSPDGCNNCRCLAGDRAGCTRRLCGDRTTWEEGRTCSEGARWEEKTGDKIQVCTCEDGEPECNSLVIITEAPEVRCLDDEDGSRAVGESWEQEGGICTCQEDGTVDCSSEVIRSTTQCLDNEGGARSVGEVWTVECNTCRCTENGLAACTLKLCGFGFAAASPQCQDRNGESRQVGEEWNEGCNTCRCGENGVPGCTKKICPSECIDRLGETRTEGEEWFVQRAGRNNQCQCLSGNVFCVAESDAVEEVEIPREKQCQDNLGSSRAIGDVWDVECNTCRCTDTGVAACTERLCNFNLGGSEQCTDSDGVSRLVGEEWEEECNSCKCNEGGVAGCTKKICFTANNGCIDRLGLARKEGETWFVERAGRKNQCKCTTGNVFCVVGPDSVTAPVIPSIRVTGEEEETGSKINFPEERRAAAGVRSSRRGGEALLRIVEEASQASQCSQAGVTRCRGVQANLALIKTLRAGSTLDLVQGEGLAMELRSLPKITRSGGFSLAFLLADGGEANIVIGTSGSMFGSIKPLSGDVHQVLESCGDNCSVLMERPSDFFNQFED